MILMLAARQNNARFVIRDGSASKTRRKWSVKTGLLTPKGVAASTDERHLFVCDTGHHKIRLAALPSRSVLADVHRITDGVEMFALAGNGKKGWRDGAALEASFNAPAGICEQADGTIIVADTVNHCIRQIRRAANGKLVVKTIAGRYAGLETTGGGHHRLRGDSKAARPRGELLVADTMNNCIRGLSQPASKGSPWKVSTLCGHITPGYADGNCAVALFDQPVGLCSGANGTFFVSDRGNACIRQVGRSFDGLGDCLSSKWGPYRERFDLRAIKTWFRVAFHLVLCVSLSRAQSEKKSPVQSWLCAMAETTSSNCCPSKKLNGGPSMLRRMNDSAL